MKAVKANIIIKFEKTKHSQNALNTILIVYFLQTRLCTENFCRQLSMWVFSADGHLMG